MTSCICVRSRRRAGPPEPDRAPRDDGLEWAGEPRHLALAAPRRDRPRSGRATTSSSARPGRTRPPTSRSGRPRRPRLWVCLFDEDGAETRHQLTEHTLGVWHGAIPGVPVGQRYGFRADGPWDPAHGRRFNPAKLLLDPYARAITGEVTARPASSLAHDAADPHGAERPSTRRPSMPRSRGRARRLRLGGRHPAAHPVARHGDLRAARQGLHPAAQRGPRGAARHLRRARQPHRHPLPPATSASPRSSCCRCTTSSPSRAWPTAGWPTTGATTRSATSPRTPPTPPRGDRGQQVTEFKQMVKDFHARRHRGDPRRRLQPHRRGRAGRADVLLPRARRRRLLQARRHRSATPTGT